jgi:exportin-1
MCTAMSDPSSPGFSVAMEVLSAFKAHPEGWRRVDAILEHCVTDHSRIIGAGVLEDAVKYRWQSLPPDQRESVRNFVAGKIVALSADEKVAAANASFLQKLDMVLVGILKQDWPHAWPAFLDEIDAASRKLGESVCENNMRILRLLSEEVFDFGSGSTSEITSDRQKKLQESLSAELQKILRLCAHVAATSTAPKTVAETLRALQGYMSWIPAAFVFETDLVRTLVGKFLPAPAFRTLTLECLTEAAMAEGGDDPKYVPMVQEMYGSVVTQISKVIPPGADIPLAVRTAKARGSLSEALLVHRLTLFLAAVFRRHLKRLESSDALRPLVLHGLNYLLGATRVDDKDLCKLVVEFWRDFAQELFDTAHAAVRAAGGPSAVLGATGAEGAEAMLRGAMAAHPRVMNYSRLLSELRMVGVVLMPRPEEVLVEKDSFGEIVRSFTKDTDALALYDVMREMMVYLTHLDPADMESIMVSKLSRQVDGSEWSWEALNSLCWAIGSISGTMEPEHEKRFLVTVIRELLGLVDLRPGKNNKAVVASNIMYVVGQYPRFLSSHWKFLKTVVYKLFEFMHEHHPGVQDMACDTFLKISQRCADSFVVVQPRESRSFVEELVHNVGSIIGDLEPHQVQAFYEAAGCMISAHHSMAIQETLIDGLLKLPREGLDVHVKRAGDSLESLRTLEATRDLTRIFTIYERVTRAVGRASSRHVGGIFMTVSSLYRTYSGFIARGAAAMGSMATSMADGAAMQRVRRSILTFFKAFMRQCRDKAIISSHFLPGLSSRGPSGEDSVLQSFASEPPLARLPEVIDVFHACVLTLKTDAAAEIGAIVPQVLRPAVELISKNFDDHPEMRHSLYRFTQALAKHSQASLLSMPPSDQKLFLDVLLWGIKHHDPFISERACLALRDFLGAVAGAAPAHASAFFSAFVVGVLQDLLFVLTDRMHKPQFVLHVEIIRGLFDILGRGTITTPLWDPRSDPQPEGTSNPQYIVRRIGTMLSRAFPNLSAGRIAAFIESLGNVGTAMEEYRAQVRDFLIDSLSFKVAESEALWRAEHAVKAAADVTRREAVPGLYRSSHTSGVAAPNQEGMPSAVPSANKMNPSTMAMLDAVDIDEDF